MDKIDLSIILPTYNERENIIEIIKEISGKLKDISCQIIVVDDDSPDGTGIAVKEAYRDNPEVEVFIRKNERGLAGAIYHGIKMAKGKRLLVMDTDGNHDPGMVKRMYALSRDYDVVIGSRFVSGGGMQDKKRYIASRVYNIFLRILLKSRVKDNLCGYFIISRERLDDINLKNIFFGYGEYFIRLLYCLQKKGCSFLEIPAFYKTRSYGRSKSKFFHMLWQYTVCAVRLKLRGR